MHAGIHSIKVVVTIICLISIFVLDFAKSVVSVHQALKIHGIVLSVKNLLIQYQFEGQIFITGESGDTFEFFSLYTHKLIKIAHEWVRWYEAN